MPELTPEIAKIVIDRKVVLRYGPLSPSSGQAGYVLSDIKGTGNSAMGQAPSQKEIYDWERNPLAPAFSPRWDQRLFNSCAEIARLAEIPYSPVCLYSHGNAGGERYPRPEEPKLGDGFTFAKTVMSRDCELLARIELKGYSRPAIDNLCRDIYEKLQGLSPNFPV